MEKIKNIAMRIFGVAGAEVNDEMSPKNTGNWDSMNYLLFIAELEKEFGITLDMDDVLSAKNLGDIKEALRVKGARL